MTDYKATPEQWAQVEAWMAIESEYSACILELRARIEALEANSESSPNPCQIGSSLAKRVNFAIYTEYARSKGVGYLEARAAIREVAAWLREKYGDDLVAATVLEREAKR